MLAVIRGAGSITDDITQASGAAASLYSLTACLVQLICVAQAALPSGEPRN